MVQHEVLVTLLCHDRDIPTTTLGQYNRQSNKWLHIPSRSSGKYHDVLRHSLAALLLPFAMTHSARLVAGLSEDGEDGRALGGGPVIVVRVMFPVAVLFSVGVAVLFPLVFLVGMPVVFIVLAMCVAVVVMRIVRVPVVVIVVVVVVVIVVVIMTLLFLLLSLLVVHGHSTATE